MEINTPWMFVTGIVIIAWYVPEFILAAIKHSCPVMINILFAVAFGLIAGSVL